MKKLLTFWFLTLLIACSAPRDKAYCDSFRLPAGSGEYAQCMAYYARMDQWFTGDLNTCRTKAELAYPDYMYDHPRFGQMETIDRFGYVRSSNVMIEPDYARNFSLDNERRSIIVPCMQAAGWKSADTWQAGHATAMSPNFVHH